jgi:hypothetical protein
MPSQHIQPVPHGIVRQFERPGSLRTVLWQRLTQAAHALWRALEDRGRRRADRELLALAERWEATNPTLARELRSYARGGSSY